MDERLSQFYVCTAQICADARLAGLTVSMTLRDGECHEGVPAAPRETSDPSEELDHTGFMDSVSVGGTHMALTDIVAVAVRRPGVE